jgi:hypothetical protein
MSNVQENAAPAKRTKYAGADWLKDMTRYPCWGSGRKRAPLGRELTSFELTVADILGGAYCGIYHVEDAVLSGQWAKTYVGLVLAHADLSTFDFDVLTGIVVMCHDACVRFSVSPATDNRLLLLFHERHGREGDMVRRHPTIEQAIKTARERRGDFRPDSERNA